MVGSVLIFQFIVFVHIFIINGENNFLALVHKWKTQLSQKSLRKKLRAKIKNAVERVYLICYRVYWQNVKKGNLHAYSRNDEVF